VYNVNHPPTSTELKNDCSLTSFRVFVNFQKDSGLNVSDCPSGGFGFQYHIRETFRGLPHFRAKCQTRTAVTYGHTVLYFLHFAHRYGSIICCWRLQSHSVRFWLRGVRTYPGVPKAQKYKSNGPAFRKSPVNEMLSFICILLRLVIPLRLAKLNSWVGPSDRTAVRCRSTVSPTRDMWFDITFMHHTPYIQDRRTDTPQGALFIYLVNKNNIWLFF